MIKIMWLLIFLTSPAEIKEAYKTKAECERVDSKMYDPEEWTCIKVDMLAPNIAPSILNWKYWV